MFGARRKTLLMLAGLIILALTVTGCFSQKTDVPDQVSIADEQQLQAQGSSEAEAVEEIPPTTTTTEPPLFVQVISLTSPVSPGGNPTTLFVKTKPGAICDIKLGYKGGQGEADALFSKQAGDNGLLSWTWSVDPSVAYGAYPVTVTTKTLDGQTASTTTQIEIKTAEECKA